MRIRDWFPLSLLVTSCAFIAAGCEGGDDDDDDDDDDGLLSAELRRDFQFLLPLYSADGAWNQRADAAPVSPTSDDQILETYRVLLGDADTLVGYDGPATDWPFMDVTYDDFSIPIFRAGFEEISVPLCNYEGDSEWPHPVFDSDEEGGPVVIPAPIGPVRPSGPDDTDADGHLVLYEPGTSFEVDIWNATTRRDGDCESWGGGYTGDDILEAGVVDLFSTDTDGISPDGWYSARATGTPLLAGLLLPEDVASGSIDHALAFSIPGPRNTAADPNQPTSADYQYPASTAETDYYNTHPHALASGQRLRLRQELVDDEGNPLDEAEFSPITRMFLGALREYGAYVVDNAGGFTFYAEDIHTASLALSDEEVLELAGQDPDGSLEDNAWQLLMETLNQELEVLPFAVGPDSSPATAQISVANFEVVEGAEAP